MPKSTSEINQEVAYELSNNLSRLLREFAKDFENRIFSKLQASGYAEIRPAHSAVFANLGMGAVRVTELAERAQVTQQAMGKMLKEIERMGYIARDVDSEDKRAKEIRLTAKGVKLAEDSLVIVKQVRSEYAEVIGESDLSKLEKMLRNSVDKINLTYLPESWSDSSAAG
ncbi:MAG: MarR family transcriptional regulator [Halioglobus sp.]